MSGSNTDSEQRDEAGRKLYETDPRVPPWESLSERQREGWRQDADARLAGQSTASQPTRTITRMGDFIPGQHRNASEPDDFGCEVCGQHRDPLKLRQVCVEHVETVDAKPSEPNRG